MTSDELREAAERLILHGETLGGSGNPYRDPSVPRVQFDEIAVGEAYLSQASTIERLQAKCRILSNSSLGNNLCPDHRDKQAGKSCLACEIERLQCENEELKETIRGKLREVIETATNVSNTNVQLRRESAELKRDAERYRWLRSFGLYHINFHDLTPDTCDVGLDAAIDAAAATGESYGDVE